MVESPRELGRFSVDANAGTHFDWFRTRLMLERTMVSWLMTSITLIGFGFAIVMIFDEFGRVTSVEPPIRPLAPFHFGLLLIATGVAALVVAGWHYQAVLRYLRHGELSAAANAGTQQPAQIVVYAITIITIFIGVFAFLAVAARIL
jgi:inner membrane protein YidH